MLKPAAPYVLSSEEFHIFASTIESLKAPSGHISNMAQYIRKKNFGGLKSHDYHVLIHQILPLATRTKNGSDEDFKGISENLRQSVESN